MVGTSKRNKFVILGVVAVLLVLISFFLWGPGTVPAGQPPLATLTSANVGAFEGAFDADADLPRLVLLLSPT